MLTLGGTGVCKAVDYIKEFGCIIRKATGLCKIKCRGRVNSRHLLNDGALFYRINMLFPWKGSFASAFLAYLRLRKSAGSVQSESETKFSTNRWRYMPGVIGSMKGPFPFEPVRCRESWR